MIHNYFIIALRSYIRNRTTSLLNFVGLTVGIVSSFLIFLYVHHELSYDRFHKQSDQIFKILSIDEALGISNNYVGITIPALAPNMKREIPGVEEIVRIAVQGRVLVRYEENILYSEDMIFTEPSFFDVFDFELKEGDRKACLEKPNTVVLTETMAKKIFRDEYPIGKMFSAGRTDNLEVTGILKDETRPGHIQFDIVASINPSPSDTNFIQYLNAWNNISMVEYALLSHPENADQITVEMDSLMRRNDVLDAWKATLQPLTEVHLYSKDVLFDRFNQNKGNIGYVRTLSLIAVIILLIASFNYLNLTIAYSSRRAREVGIRKVVGSNKKQLIVQHLSEAILQVFLSVVIALVITEVINRCFPIIDRSVFSYIFSYPLSLVFLILLIITLGLFSGAYPAIILSAFRPHVVLKGELVAGKKGWLLRRALVTLQFIATFVMITGTIIVTKQMKYTLNKDKGFNSEQIINIRMNPEVRDSYEVLKANFEEIPGIKMFATSGSMPGWGYGRSGIVPEGALEDEDWIVSAVSVNEKFIPLMQMEMVEGDNFREDMSQEPAPIIVNESLVKAIGWESGLNKKIGYGGDRQAQIIGVVKDFHFTSFRHQIEPLILRYRPDVNSVLSIKINRDNLSEAIEAMEATWLETNEGIPFEYTFFDESFRDLFEKEEDFTRMFFRFTLLSIIIAILGLFGLAAFSAALRTKEIGIRKVFGASIIQMVVLQSYEYTRLVFIAIIVSIPVSYFIMHSWLKGFVYKSEMGVFPYIISAVIIILVTLITVSIHALRSAQKNPATTLKYE